AGTPCVDQRQHNQANRIFNDVKNGELTFRETRQLLRGQARVHRREAYFKSDRIVTPRKRYRLFHIQTRQDFRIYRRKHN
ncbi:MAG TPA: hypothetical protein VK862_21445, partial [Afifellaceae bacterium]|nr:hypothetical protein [Afifellaceae bacterium]